MVNREKFGQARLLLSAVAVTALAGLHWATPASADAELPGPCGSGMDNIADALDIDPFTEFLPNSTEPLVCNPPGILCSCGSCYPSPCKCRVNCLCSEPGAYEGNFTYCMFDLLAGLCPGEHW